ncbi:MAG: hypothetical protein U5L96_10385 [Owenweeksia sp.]|nr:hypothetical protein [Owenweeksia sp.]
MCENWDALVLNDYDAVWPLPVRTKWGFKYFYRPFAVQQLGVFSKKALGEEELHSFVDNMQQHCHFADLYLNEGQLLKVKALKHIRSTLQLNLGLSLACSFREIYHGYSESNP